MLSSVTTPTLALAETTSQDGAVDTQLTGIEDQANQKGRKNEPKMVEDVRDLLPANFQRQTLNIGNSQVTGLKDWKLFSIGTYNLPDFNGRVVDRYLGNMTMGSNYTNYFSPQAFSETDAETSSLGSFMRKEQNTFTVWNDGAGDAL